MIANVIVEATGARKLLFHSAHNITRQEFNSGLGYLDFKRRNVENLRIALH
jgi:zinc transport system substrate-binding protein